MIYNKPINLDWMRTEVFEDVTSPIDLANARRGIELHKANRPELMEYTLTDCCVDFSTAVVSFDRRG